MNRMIDTKLIDIHANRAPKVRRLLYRRVRRGAGRRCTCWEWTGTRNKGGKGGTHGRMFLDGRMVLAHRLSWELHVGPIPEGMCVLHKCANPPCVNPRHLYVGTQADNARDRSADGNSTKGRAMPECGHPGESHRCAKLTDEKVREARRRYANGETQADLAREMGVRNNTLSVAIRRKTWRHVE